MELILIISAALIAGSAAVCWLKLKVLRVILENIYPEYVMNKYAKPTDIMEYHPVIITAYGLASNPMPIQVLIMFAMNATFEIVCDGSIVSRGND